MHLSRNSLARAAAIAGLCALFVAAASLAPRDGAVADAPGGFVSELVLGDLPTSTDFAFAPDGRIFLAEKSGRVSIIQDGALLPDAFATVPANDHFARGLLAIELDPDFAANGYVYLYYVHEDAPAQESAPKTARLVRLTAEGNLSQPGSDVVLLGEDGENGVCSELPPGADCLPADGLDHFGGGLRFAPDGTLYLSTGDAAMGLDDARMLLRPQDIDDLAGKLLRINSDGSASAGNPFLTDDPHANRSKVWSYGFRNPFRLAVDPATRVPVVGDVGSFYWEELNAARPGSNFGWPCYEGMYQHPTQMILPDCIAMYAAAVATAHPMYFYQNPIFTGGASVMAGTFNAGTAYPADFDGAFFFGDWAGAWIRALHVDSDGNLAPDSVNDVLSNAGAPVAFRGGPDGDVYYLTLDVLTGESQLRRVEYLPGNRPPVALATASPGGGAVPLTVEFSSDGSYDPDGDDVGYLWDFGDGATSTDEDPSHTFVTAGAYDVELTVSDEHGLAAGASLHIVAGRHPPVATITSPPAGGVYVEGASLPFSGSAFDKEDGALPGLDLSWRIVLHHCDAGGGCHTHPFWSQSGPDGTLPTPHHNNEVMYLEFTLTATDSDGLADSATATAGNDTDVDGLADHLEVLEFGTDRLRADTDGDGCSDGAELGDNERVGGQRAPLNPWDYFNPSEDGQNRIDDVIDVVEQAFVDAGQPGYRLETDRSFTSPALQDVGPPDGLQRVEDVLGIVAQYFHDCD